MIAPPGRRLSGGRARADEILGAPPPGAPALRSTQRDALRDKAAATLFAFYVLTEPEAFSPAVDRLDDWAARYGAPPALALAFYRRAPELFGASAAPTRSSALSRPGGGGALLR